MIHNLQAPISIGRLYPPSHCWGTLFYAPETILDKIMVLKQTVRVLILAATTNRTKHIKGIIRQSRIKKILFRPSWGSLKSISLTLGFLRDFVVRGAGLPREWWHYARNVVHQSRSYCGCSLPGSNKICISNLVTRNPFRKRLITDFSFSRSK